MKEAAVSELGLLGLTERLNAGGWYRSLGFGRFEPVQKASYTDEVLIIDHVTIKQPTVTLGRPGEILVSEFYIQREQKKKVEGGGWREKSATRFVLRLVEENFVRAAKETITRQKEQERRQMEEQQIQEVARKLAEAEKKVEDEQKRLARGVQFLANLNEKYRGKKLADQNPIRLEEQTLTLTFEDGDTLTVDLFEAGEDWYYRLSHLIVNNTSAESFE